MNSHYITPTLKEIELGKRIVYDFLNREYKAKEEEVANLLSRHRHNPWKPISTAPKDRRIRLYSCGREWSECEWQEGGVISEEGFWHMVESEGWFTELKNPTHWQELSAPPEE